MSDLPSRERAAELALELASAGGAALSYDQTCSLVEIARALGDGRLVPASAVADMRERAAGEVGGCITYENEWWMNGYLRSLAESIRALPPAKEPRDD